MLIGLFYFFIGSQLFGLTAGLLCMFGEYCDKVAEQEAKKKPAKVEKPEDFSGYWTHD